MDDFVKKIEDLYKRSINKNIITCTGFLTPAERQIVLSKFNGTKMLLSGGVEEAERVRVFFLPDYINDVTLEEYIVAFKASFSFKELSHRDFLGALLALGLQRRCLGDIFVFEKEAYFFVTNDISKFIINNLTKVGSVGVKIRKIGLSEVKVVEPTFKEIKFTVPSLRLDSIVAGSIKESREKSHTYIKDGAVLLNYLVCDNSSKELKEGDVFSVKGYGKFKLIECGGVSKRGKRFIKVNKYM